MISASQQPEGCDRGLTIEIQPGHKQERLPCFFQKLLCMAEADPFTSTLTQVPRWKNLQKDRQLKRKLMSRC